MNKEVLVDKSRIKTFEDILISKGFFRDDDISLVYKTINTDAYQTLKDLIFRVVSLKCLHDGDEFRENVNSLKTNQNFFDPILRIYNRIILDIFDQLESNEDLVSITFKEDLENSIRYELKVDVF